MLIPLDEILNSSIIEKKAKGELELVIANQAMATGEMLGTIMLPNNLNALSNRLPKPNYESKKKKSASVEELIAKLDKTPMNLRRGGQPVIGGRPPPSIKNERKIEDVEKKKVVIRMNVPIRGREVYNYKSEERKIISSQQQRHVIHEDIKEQNNDLHPKERKIISSQEPKRYIARDLPLLELPTTKQYNRRLLIPPLKIPYMVIVIIGYIINEIVMHKRESRYRMKRELLQWKLREDRRITRDL